VGQAYESAGLVFQPVRHTRKADKQPAAARAAVGAPPGRPHYHSVLPPEKTVCPFGPVYRRLRLEEFACSTGEGDDESIRGEGKARPTPARDSYHESGSTRTWRAASAVPAYTTGSQSDPEGTTRAAGAR